MFFFFLSFFFKWDEWGIPLWIVMAANPFTSVSILKSIFLFLFFFKIFYIFKFIAMAAWNLSCSVISLQFMKSWSRLSNSWKDSDGLSDLFKQAEWKLKCSVFRTFPGRKFSLYRNGPFLIICCLYCCLKDSSGWLEVALMNVFATQSAHSTAENWD